MPHLYKPTVHAGMLQHCLVQLICKLAQGSSRNKILRLHWIAKPNIMPGMTAGRVLCHLDHNESYSGLQSAQPLLHGLRIATAPYPADSECDASLP